MERGKMFLKLGKIADVHGGKIVNIQLSKGSAVWVHFDFDNMLDIDRFLQTLMVENIGKLASSNTKSCQVLI